MLLNIALKETINVACFEPIIITITITIITSQMVSVIIIIHINNNYFYEIILIYNLYLAKLYFKCFYFLIKFL